MLENFAEKYNAFLARRSVRRALFWLTLAMGVFARVYLYGLAPIGINQDEAFAGYEAWSLMNDGIDTAGYHNPVYLTAWGSGMNALETYLMMPFIAVLGLKPWVIRLPQLIVACLSIWVLYLLVRRTVSERAGLFAMFMLAICPWHIMMSRWGLESNLAPGFLLFGLYFFVAALDDPRLLPVSALMYGLSLYTYATVWIYVPVMLAVQLIYCMAYKKIRFTRHLALFVLVLFVMAVPLLLFLLVNYGYIDEIRTPLFSVPKLLYMRTGEISFDEKARKLEIFKSIFLAQDDGWIWSSPKKYGLFYRITMPFALAGLVGCIVRFAAASRRREFCPEALLPVQLIVCLPQLILIKGNVNRFNMLFIPLVIMAALGVYYLAKLSWRPVLGVLAAVYIVLFAGFECYYFTEYAHDETLLAHFSYGLEDALELACEKGDIVYLDENEYYPKVLFYTKTPVTTFRDTVEYLYYPAPYLHALSFDRFRFWDDPYKPEDNAAYIIPKGDSLGILEESGFTFEYRGNYVVAYKER